MGAIEFFGLLRAEIIVKPYRMIERRLKFDARMEAEQWVWIVSSAE